MSIGGVILEDMTDRLQWDAEGGDCQSEDEDGSHDGSLMNRTLAVLPSGIRAVPIYTSTPRKKGAYCWEIPCCAAPCIAGLVRIHGMSPEGPETSKR